MPRKSSLLLAGLCLGLLGGARALSTPDAPTFDVTTGTESRDQVRTELDSRVRASESFHQVVGGRLQGAGATPKALPHPSEITLSAAATNPESDVDYEAEGFDSLEEMREAVADELGIDDLSRITFVTETRNGVDGLRVSIDRRSDEERRWSHLEAPPVATVD